MNLYELYSSMLVASSVLSGLTLILMLKYRANRIARGLLATVFASLGVTLSLLLGAYSSTNEAAVFWHGNIRLIFNIFFLPASFIFVYTFLGGKNAKLIWFTLVIPILTVFISLTNNFHHLLFSAYAMERGEYYLRVSWQPGIWFMALGAYSYAIVFGLVYLLMSWVGRTKKLPRWRGLLILATSVMITAAYTLDTFGYALAPGILNLPIGLAVMNLAYIIGVWYLNLFDILPVARETLTQYMSDAIFVVDSNNVVLDVNPAGVKLIDRPASDILGKNIVSFMPREDRAKQAEEILENEFLGILPLDIQSQDRFFDILLTNIYIEQNVVAAKLLVLRDITKRKRIEEALLESEEKHRSLFETMAQGVVYQSTSGEIISFNQAAERILGVSLDQLQGRTSLDPRWKAIHENGSVYLGEEHPAMLALQTGQEVRNQIMGVYNPKTAGYRWINIHAVPQFRQGESTPYQVYATFDDITHFKQLQEEERQRVALEERQRLARDLHDAVSQTLFSARVTSEVLLRQKNKSISQKKVWEHVAHLDLLVKSALGEMRILLLELRPESLINADLPALLAHLVDAAASRIDAEINLDIQGKEQTPVDVKIAFYRIAQESLNNMIKHADSTKINICLTSSRDFVKIIAEDNGVGLRRGKSSGASMGIKIMRERASEIGAKLEISSKPKQGTRVTCTWQRKENIK
jgi:PAS domain S-box-containing protein